MPETLEELDGLLLTAPKHGTVQRDGIHFQGQRYFSPTLAPYVGKPVTIRYDPRDVKGEALLEPWSPSAGRSTGSPSPATPR